MPYDRDGILLYTPAESLATWGKKVACEVYSRVVGYLRPVQNWNKAKRQEFKDRTNYKVEKEEER